MRIGYTGTGRSSEFRYDAFGRRTAVIESDGTTATETRYLWCGERICQARDSADTVTRRYYDEGELAVSATGDVAAFYAEDHLGSIRDLRMGDGQVQASYDYDPYGAPTRTDETGGVTADYRYAGLVHHAPSGLYLAHYRAYSPTIGRWVSRDPIFEAGGVNLYAYVDNNPLKYIDPYGLSKFDKLYGLPKQFWNWYHRKEKRPGDPDLTKDEARDLYKEWQDRGKPKPDSKGKQDGFADPDLLEWLIPWPLIPSELGCGDLDCNHNGIPDHEEENPCK